MIQVLYSILVFRDYINKSRPPVKGVAIEIRTHFREIETSEEPVRASNYVLYLGLQHDEPEMQYDLCECLLRLLAKFTLILMITVYLRLINCSQHFVLIMVTPQIMMVYDWSLHLKDSSIVQK